MRVGVQCAAAMSGAFGVADDGHSYRCYAGRVHRNRQATRSLRKMSASTGRNESGAAKGRARRSMMAAGIRRIVAEPPCTYNSAWDSNDLSQAAMGQDRLHGHSRSYRPGRLSVLNAHRHRAGCHMPGVANCCQRNHLPCSCAAARAAVLMPIATDGLNVGRCQRVDQRQLFFVQAVAGRRQQTP